MESDDFGHVFDNFVRICSLFDFGNPEWDFFQMKKIRPCFKMIQIYASIGVVLVGKSIPTTPDWLWSQLKLSVMFQEQSWSFLVRTAIQGQRGGSIINMKGTERDRPKPSINKGV